MHISHMNVARR